MVSGVGAMGAGAATTGAGAATGATVSVVLADFLETLVVAAGAVTAATATATGATTSVLATADFLVVLVVELILLMSEELMLDI